MFNSLEKRSNMQILVLILTMLSSMISVTSRSHIQLHEQLEEWKPSPYPRIKANTAIFFMGDSTTERVYKYGMLGTYKMCATIYSLS